MRTAAVLIATTVLVAGCTAAQSSPIAESSLAAQGASGAAGGSPPSSVGVGAAAAGSPASSGTAMASPHASDSPDATSLDLGGPAPVGSFVLGDSISLSSEVGPVLARLGYPLLGVVGQSASESYLRTHLSTPTAQRAPAWVIELGTNNSSSPAEAARIAGWLDVIASLRSRTNPQDVYWVTPHRPAAYSGSLSASDLDGFNAELKRLAVGIPWLHIIDFDAAASAHPEWFDADTAMHLHPDERGQAVLVALIAGPDAVPAATPAPMATGPAPTAPERSPDAASPGEFESQTFDNATMEPMPSASAPDAEGAPAESVSPAPITSPGQDLAPAEAAATPG